jgi:hypothetical protein
VRELSTNELALIWFIGQGIYEAIKFFASKMMAHTEMFKDLAHITNTQKDMAVILENIAKIQASQGCGLKKGAE